MWKVVPVFVVVGNGETGSCRKHLCISQRTAPVQRIIFFELVGQPGHIIRKIFQRGQIKVYLVSGEHCQMRLGDRLQLGDDNPGQAFTIFGLVETRDK